VSEDRGTSGRMTVLAVLKDEPLTKVEVVALGDLRAVRKTYATPPSLRWRTFCTPSRAYREYRGLSAAFGRGVPCVEPLGWTETRRRLCARTSTVFTRLVEAAPSVKQLLRGDGVDARARTALAVALGRLLRQLHQAGVVSCRMMPRNVLVRSQEPWDLLLCDLPAAVPFRSAVRSPLLASIDLYDAMFSWSRTLEMSRVQRWRALLSYHDGATLPARRDWRRLVRRPAWKNRMLKAVLVCWDSYLGLWWQTLTRGGLPRPEGVP
jgi:hypothetical protein